MRTDFRFGKYTHNAEQEANEANSVKYEYKKN